MYKDTERRWMKLELNALYPEIHKIDIEPKVIVVTHNPELVQQITDDARELLKLNMSSMYGRIGTVIIDEVHHKNGTWANWIDWFDSKNSGFANTPTFINIEPLIPNRFDLMERAKNDPKFECHQRIKAHKANPAKRKASKLARKARSNNK